MPSNEPGKIFGDLVRESLRENGGQLKIGKERGLKESCLWLVIKIYDCEIKKGIVRKGKVLLIVMETSDRFLNFGHQITVKLCL
jgi:hypothetical protein